MSQVWINGTLTDKVDARVSPFDHGLLYGDGVWEHLRLFNGKPFRAQDHLKILSAAAEAIGIDIPLSPEELLAAINATAKANNRTEGYVRVIVTRGPGTIGPDPRKIEPQVIITAEEYRPFPDELYGSGLHAVVAPSVDRNNPVFRHRTLNQLHVVQAKRLALQSGCLEALFKTLDNRDIGAGAFIGSTEGWLFVVNGGEIGIAPGETSDATAGAIVTVAEDAGIVIKNAMPRYADIFAAEEVFIAGTACGVIGIVRIDGEDIGTGTEGPVTRRIRNGYQHLTQLETK